MSRMISARVTGDWKKTDQFFDNALKRKYLDVLKGYAELGVRALQEATPVDSGETANSWGYEIENGNGITRLYFTNSNEKNGVNVAILLIYGHGTRNGGYVEGNDFVSPALQPIFKNLADSMFREITR